MLDLFFNETKRKQAPTTSELPSTLTGLAAFSARNFLSCIPPRGRLENQSSTIRFTQPTVLTFPDTGVYRMYACHFCIHFYRAFVVAKAVERWIRGPARFIKNNKWSSSAFKPACFSEKESHSYILKVLSIFWRWITKVVLSVTVPPCDPGNFYLNDKDYVSIFAANTENP